MREINVSLCVSVSYFDIIGATTTERQKERQTSTHADIHEVRHAGRSQASKDTKSIHSCRKALR